MEGAVNAGAETAAQKLGNELTYLYSLDPSQLYAAKSGAISSTAANFTGIEAGNPMDQIRHLFKSGSWLNTYELPFFQNTYLQANGYQYWQTGNLQSIGGENGLTQFAKGSLKIDFPTQPSFNFNDITNCRI